MTIYHTAGDRTPYTYLIGWSQYNKWYYGVRYAKGCHPTDFWNPYRTSSKIVAEFITEFGEPDIMKLRKIFDDVELARNWEYKFLTKISAKDSDQWLNKSPGGKSFYFLRTGPLTQSHKDKISISHKGISHPQTLETKNKISSTMTGRKLSEQHKMNLSISKTGKSSSDETKQKIRIITKGNTSKRDKNIYHLLNDDGQEFIGIRSEFEKLYRETNVKFYRIIECQEKNRSPHKGWRLLSVQNIDPRYQISL